MVHKFSKGWLKFNILIVQSMQIVLVKLMYIAEFFSK